MNIEILKEYEAKGLISRGFHSKYPLFIWNYTPKTQYEKLWDEITLSCRALVTDDNGHIVARSFKKFFNIEEEKRIPNEDFKVYEKIDGSLILVFYYNNELIISSKGSFYSEHSEYAKKIIFKYNIDSLKVDRCYSFEMIAPWNRIVCDYGNKEELILLAIFDKHGNEYEISSYSAFFPTANTFVFTDLNSIKNSITNDKEGYVVKFAGGKRIKIKGSHYVHLHRIISGISERSILEMLSKGMIGELDEMFALLPDELYEWAKETKNKFESEFYSILTECRKSFKIFSSRKETAAYFLQQKHPQLFFAVLDGKDLDPIIWKIISTKNKNEL